MNKPNYIFKDENGEEYVSSPKYNYSIDTHIMFATMIGLLPLMGLLIYSVSI